MVYSNFYDSFWYTPTPERDSAKPAIFLLQQPSYKLYTFIGKTKETPNGVLRESIDHLLLQHCVVGAINVEYTTPLDLPIEIQQELNKVIIDLFYPTEAFFSSLDFNLNATLDDKFSNDSWSCEVCKSKNLHKQRNCPFLPIDEYHEKAYSITIGSASYNVCPMNLKDTELLHAAFEAYRIAESGFLPTTGGYGEQPLLFCVLSQKVKEKINYFERRQLEEQRTKVGRK